MKNKSMKYIFLIYIILQFNIVFASVASVDPAPIAPPQGLVPSGLIQLGDGQFQPDTVIIADKSRRTLSVWQNKNNKIQLLDYYAMDHGKKNGNKNVQGDLKTPEGIYFVQDKKHANELDFNEYGVMAFTLNYPNHFDHMKRKTGGGIWLHSIPPIKTLKRGSRGCLVLREDSIKKVDQHIRLNRKAPILIYEKVEYITQERLDKLQAQYLGWLNQWKSSWENKDSDNYIANYSTNFYAIGKNYKAWKRYKKSINDSNKKIQVNLKNTVIYKNQEQIIVRFLQEYSSDNVSDFGEKTLYIRLEGNSPKIVTENWTEEKKELLGLLDL